MAPKTKAGVSADAAETPRRRYNSPIREQRATETRERIIAAASGLVHELPTWEWDDLTFRAVAQRAAVSERTVYRHFPSERHLHDAVMARLEEEAGVSYEDLTLVTIAPVAAKVFDSLASFAAAPPRSPAGDSTFRAEDDRRRQALCAAVDSAAPGWTDTQRECAAAALDVLWAVPSYERLVAAWTLDQARATAVISWLINLVVEAVDRNAPPVVDEFGQDSGRSVKMPPMPE